MTVLSRRTALALPLLALRPVSAASQPGEGWSAALSALQIDGRYFPALAHARKVDPTPADGPVDQLAAFVGEEAIALRGSKDRTPAPDVEKATAQDAIQAVVQAARGRRVVMLNEAHNASRHRAFLATLLRALRKEGFTHLAAETFLNTSDPGAFRLEDLTPGKSLLGSSGFYIADPVFAEAVREARDLGYRFCAYEQRRDQSDPTLKGNDAIARRETKQTENFARILADNPTARFLVFVGYSHLREQPDGSGNVWFASRLKTATGIDPLTVAQSLSGAFGPHAAESPVSRAVLDRFSPKAPIVVRLRDGEVLLASKAAADLVVFHPALPDVDGRPGWLAADPNRRRVRIALPKLQEPFLVQALRADEPDSRIPADQYAPRDDATHAVLFLRPGGYRVQLETEAGHRLLREIRA